MEADEKRRGTAQRDGSRRRKLRRTRCSREKKRDTVRGSQTGFKSTWVVTVCLAGQRLPRVGIGPDAGNLRCNGKHFNHHLIPTTCANRFLF